MHSRSLRRRALPLLLCAGLLAAGASAASPHQPKPTEAAAPVAPSLLDRAWRFFQSLWAEEGCRIDPNGRCATGTSQAPAPRSLFGESGCRIDPNGRCATGTAPAPRPATATDTGCRLDPDGLCHS